jgi:hypothetical protein
MTEAPSPVLAPTRASRRPTGRLLLVLAAAILALLPAGCAGREQGPAASSGHPPNAGEVRLVVSRDFGATVLTDVTVPLGKDASVMRLLAEHAHVQTAYGGGFVKAIDGLASTYGGVSSGTAQDWFYWVDGVMADVGAVDFRLRGGETVWWDYHAWSHAMYLPAAICALPAPWAGRREPLSINGSDTLIRAWAQERGVALGASRPLGGAPPPGGVVVATASEAAATPWLAKRLSGADGGVALVRPGAGTLTLTSLDGSTGPHVQGVCLALPDPGNGDAPLLVFLVARQSDLAALLSATTPSAVRARLGIAVDGSDVMLLPWSGG